MDTAAVRAALFQVTGAVLVLSEQVAAGSEEAAAQVQELAALLAGRG